MEDGENKVRLVGGEHEKDTHSEADLSHKEDRVKGGRPLFSKLSRRIQIKGGNKYPPNQGEREIRDPPRCQLPVGPKPPEATP